jgi:regulator of sirC expression with transglutaminase-like and TPR domain
MKGQKEIQALIRLIEDPDESVFLHVRDRLLTYGPVAIPYLETSWEHEEYGLIFQSRVENLIHEIQFEEVKHQLKNWVESPDKDLLRGSIIVARYQYSGMDEAAIHELIQQLRRDIWLELNDAMTAYEKVKIFNRIFFGIYHFHGDAKHFHSPMNSFINTVVESRKGNPLSLCLIYSIVAQSLDLPIYGVNLPNHFILAYMDENGSSRFLEEKNDYGVLFYINPFSKGTIFAEKEIKEFLDSLSLPHNRSYFEPCSNSDILRRMLTNLIASFQQSGSAQKVEELTELRDLIH